MTALKEAIEKVNRIDGWLTDNEAATLYELASKATGPIVEIGSWQGRSTAALSLGSMAGNQQPVFAVDSFDGVPPLDRPTASGIRPGWKSSSPELLRKNLDSLGINGLVRIVPKPSTEAAAEIPECALLFVDGAHDYESVKRDLELYLPKVKIGGHVVIHDCVEGDPGVVQAVDEKMSANSHRWRCRWRADSAVVFEHRETKRHQVLLGFPGNNLNYGAAKGLAQATLGAHDVTLEQSGMGWDDMNRLWVYALNQAAKGYCTHFAMLHSDIEPSPGWIDLLLDEMEDRKADLISAVAALKDQLGLTSCGVGERSNPWCAYRRFTMRELMTMPETFGIDDTPHADKYLLHNTGCWVADLRNPKWRSVDHQGCLLATLAFPIRARLLESGEFVHERESEDWHFSRGVADLGLRTFVTRRVFTVHHGSMGYRNNYAWGKWDHDEATAHKWRGAS